MARSAQKFADLLTEGVHRIKIQESKTVQVVHDELGYLLGRKGGSAIEHWRKGNFPPSLADVEKLACEIVTRGDLGRNWLEKFLVSYGHPYAAHLCDRFFPLAASGQPQLSPSPPRSPSSSALNGSSPKKETSLTEFNTFIIGLPITHPRHFFGRTYELKRIFGLWKRLPLQNVAVIGLRRSGKTSLLHYLKQITITPSDQLRPDQQANWLPKAGSYQWVLVDFRDPRMCQRERLLRYLLTSLAMSVPEPCDLETFMDTVSLYLRQPTIILMDEIGTALTAPDLDMEFWGSLRSLGTNLTGGKLAFLLTAHESPALLAQQQGKPSPFFNIFGHTFALGPLTDPEAQALLASSPRPFDSEDIGWILAQSEGWPCRLQALAHARLTALEFGETGDGWKQEGLRQMPPH